MKSFCATPGAEFGTKAESRFRVPYLPALLFNRGSQPADVNDSGGRVKRRASCFSPWFLGSDSLKLPGPLTKKRDGAESIIPETFPAYKTRFPLSVVEG
jgi:hypothetical protein